jgi:hypothetical protein
MKSLAPIALFVYNRPDHTMRTLEALALNAEAKESELYIFCDGSRPGATASTLDAISEVRSIVRSEKRFKNIIVHESSTNKGLANSIVQGVAQVLSQHDSIIVLEDDLVVAPKFLSYMNQALDKYKHHHDVACISAYLYPLKSSYAEAFFIRGADCWGWATWKDKWTLFEPDPAALRSKIKEQDLEREFNFNGNYPYMQMLEDRIAGKNQSWAVLWYASAFIKNKLCLYPSSSLVQNIGNDGSGTHFTSASNVYLGESATNKEVLLPNIIAENKLARTEFGKFLRTLTPSPSALWVRKIKNIIKKLLKRN